MRKSRKMKKLINISVIAIPLFFQSQDIPYQKASSLMMNMATPNVANIERFGESPVNYYSGKTGFSVPIFTIKAGNITYPITLNYSAGGIQVNSMASDVGLGWSITDTFVNRTIVGDADYETLPNVYKTNSENCNTWENTTYTNVKWGYFYKILTVPTYHYTTVVDYFPDIFKFNSPQGQTRFYFPTKDNVRDLDKKNTQIQWNVITKKYSYLTDKNPFNGNVVNVNSQQCVTDYDNFTITTKDGLKYYFQDKDIYHSFTSSEALYTSFGSIAGTYPKVGSWHVSKITDNVTGQEINFIYEEYTTESTNDIETILANHTKYDCTQIYPTKASNIQISCWIPGNGNVSSGNAVYYNRGLNIKRLKKITFPSGSIEFNYNQNRTDLYNGKALTNIVIKDYNGKIINEFELKYDYFYSTVQKNEFSKRLKLLSIQESGKNKYQFEYYEDNKMPNIGSAFQDFFGYCNQVEPSSNNSVNSSKYYYYPGKREFSILPYNISTDSNHYVLNGNINKEPNELSKTWSLKKVTFPTGGTNFYDLESNTFSLWGSDLKGGGVRVKQQVVQESPNSPSRIINYYYTNTDNSSSGYLFNVPYTGHPGTILYNTNSSGSPDLSSLDLPNLNKYFFLYNNAKINYDILNNFFIGYSKIEENEDGIKTVYEFYNDEYPNIQTRSTVTHQGVTNFESHCMSGFLVVNSALGNEAYIDRSRLRGKLHYMSNYDTSGNLLRKQENVYESFTEDDYNPSGEEYYVYGANVIQKGGGNDGGSDTDYAELISTEKGYNSLYNNLVYTKTTDFLPSGDFVEETNYGYDLNNQNLFSQSTKIKNGNSYPPYYQGISYIYPYQMQEQYAQDLVNINKINLPIVTKKSEGDLNYGVKQQTKILFSKNTATSDKILPVQAMQANDGSTFYEVGTFDRYDNKGNLLQSTKDGITTTYIYGYNQNYPIAKLDGATYEQVMTAFGLNPNDNQSYLSLEIVSKSNQDTDEPSENTLITALDQFRSNAGLANYQVTTYTHNPLVGVTSVTPPSGIRENYIYDTANRLEKVVDVNGKLLKEYKYNYKQ